MRLDTRHLSDGGFSLFEALIAISLLTVMFGVTLVVADTSTRSLSTGSAVSEIDRRALRVLDGICEDLRYASRDKVFPTPQPPFSSPFINFQTGAGVQDGVLVYEDLRRIELQRAEIDDGLDNNGNGLIDEGRIVLLEHPGLADARESVLSDEISEYAEGELPNGIDDNGNGLVDERGLSFSIEGDRVWVRMTIEHVDAQGARIVRTVERAITFRNPSHP